MPVTQAGFAVGGEEAACEEAQDVKARGEAAGPSHQTPFATVAHPPPPLRRACHFPGDNLVSPGDVPRE
eukprot:7890098-Prorocentrum_lima.AAC.1